MKTGIELKLVFLVVMLLGIVIFLVVGSPTIGLNTDVATNLIAVIPGVFVVSIGIMLIFLVKGYFRFAVGGVIGIGLAVLAAEADTIGLITADLYSGLTLVELQTWCIMVGLIMGAVTGFQGE